MVQETITTQEYSVHRQTDSYDDDGYGDDDNATARLTHCLIFSCAAPLKMKRVEEKEQVKQV